MARQRETCMALMAGCKGGFGMAPDGCGATEPANVAVASTSFGGGASARSGNGGGGGTTTGPQPNVCALSNVRHRVRAAFAPVCHGVTR